MSPAEKPGLAVCVGCGSHILDQYILRVSPDLEWHAACLKCAECSQYLDENCTCFVRDGKTYCKRDYIRNGSTHMLNDNGRSSLRSHIHKQTEKTTRVRTVLNEKQLHTLRTCYAANPRPDALMKEQLVEMTGLSPRVIRVWFQNKRCKDKKKSILMKQIQQQQQLSDKTSLQGLTGTPLVAGSPIRHDSAVQGTAVEVQTYQPPWKALSDFALQSDLDQPAFQQLIIQKWKFRQEMIVFDLTVDRYRSQNQVLLVTLRGVMSPPCPLSFLTPPTAWSPALWKREIFALGLSSMDPA
ncbi:unnamed protein product [Ranitomeya imitator]|uniref:ISL LIM homeobox 2 n=1 Tax=Ranitomeya imitator TaxID=111125 RepID=A0ABN9ME69_9NEOB|nr:unnamed protein product [Ranitomeya imitator]